jgi:hypothetical protein
MMIRFVILSLVSMGLLLLPVQNTHGHTPESEEVQALLKKAIAFLDGADHSRPGGRALIGYALLKAGIDPKHPKIRAAVSEARRLAATVRRSGMGQHNYDAAIACLLLADLNPQLYREEIKAFIDAMVDRQTSNGCWAYDPYTGYDDTSQSQYGVLCLWAGHVHGLDIDSESVVAAMNWFHRTQQPEGGWVYRAADPQNPPKVPHSQGQDQTMSMSAAGMGSVYICAYLLGWGKSETGQTDGRPVALKKVERATERRKYLSDSGANRSTFASVIGRGKNKFGENFRYEPEGWTYYAMYAIERYKAFEAIVDGRKESEPSWYNKGVDFLQKTQAADGSWQSRHSQATPSVSTSFAVLFLTRSTEKAIQASEQGQVRGGSGLPADLSQITVNPNGQVVDATETPPIEMLLSELEKDDGNEVDPSIPVQLALSDNPRVKAAEVARLRRMVMSGKYQARLVAVQTLGHDRDLNNVPVLIFALSDPDRQVARAARDGLRFVSRKLNGFGLADRPEDGEWRAVQNQWKKWYLSIDPNGSLIE